MANEPETTQIDTDAFVKPDEKLDPATPIGDEAKAAADAELKSKYEGLDEKTEFPEPEKADSVEDDVHFALERETQDGKGDDEVPESDFVSFATDGVEKESD